MSDYQQYNYPPTPPPYMPPKKQRARPAIIVGLLILAGVGLILNQQPVSLASGSSVVWMGFALTVIAAVAAFIIPDVPAWVKVVLLALAVIAFGSAIYIEHELAQRRREINDILSNLSSY
jgi:hypothetical protein